MTRQDEEQVARLMVDAVGGRTPWVVLWSDDDADSGVMSSVPPQALPELVCVYLLKMLRREMSVPDVIAREQ